MSGGARLTRRRANVVRGLIAGAAGTLATDVVTYLDMVIRGRAASRTPAEAADRLAERAGIPLKAGLPPERVENRETGLGALLGYSVGLGVGAALGLAGRRQLPLSTSMLLLTAAAMLGGNVPLVALGVTNPRGWTVSDWLADLVPHAAYGTVTAGVYRALE